MLELASPDPDSPPACNAGLSLEVCWPVAFSGLIEADEVSARSVDTAKLSQAVRTNVSSALVFGVLEFCDSVSLSPSEMGEAKKQTRRKL